jgi:hypothetical protein
LLPFAVHKRFNNLMVFARRTGHHSSSKCGPHLLRLPRPGHLLLHTRNVCFKNP